MTSRKSIGSITVALVMALTMSLLAPAGSAATKKEKFETLAAQILETLQSFYPVKATEMGIHSYDHRLADYSNKSVKDMVKKLKDYEVKLHKYANTSFAPEDRINYRLIKSNVDIALLHLDKIRWHKRSPQLYADEALNGVYFLMISEHVPLSERLYPLLDRMRAVPGLLQTARKNLKDPAPIYIELAVTSFEGAIDFYQQVASELMNKFPDKADEILKVSTQAREAMNDFAVYLQQMPAGDEKSFAVGKSNLDYVLSHEYFLEFDADSVLAIGEQMLATAQQDYEEYMTFVEENHQNGQDSVFVPQTFTAADVMDYYRWELDQTRLFLERTGILTVPESIGPVEVVETPPYLQTMITSWAYQPVGPFDDGRPGMFYVRPIPADSDREQLEAKFRYAQRRGFRGAVVHEVYPGHHLQMQIAAHHAHSIRKWQTNYMFIEGWALYCEEMTYNAGLYGHEDPAEWLKVLRGIMFRAARIVADVKLHTGQFTVDECVRYMADALGVVTESGMKFIREEVRRYTHSPAYQLSYLMGKREIMMLREAAEDRDGEEFSERDFHDALLAEGSIPPTLMWEILGFEKP